MATEIKLPRLGQGMESGTVVRWLKQEGERVEKGEPLYELDTEKVTQEVEADASGVLLKIAVQEGEVPVGGTIAVIGEEGEDVPEGEPEVEEAPEGEPEVEEAPEEEGSRAPARDEERERGKQAEAPEQPTMSEQITEVREPSRDDGRIKASPLARRIARERGIDLGQIRGTGPEGRIVAEDIERAVAAPAPAAAAPAAPAAVAGEPETEQLTSIRKTIARRLTQAWEAPVFQLVMSAEMTRAQELRERLVELTREGEAKPTVSDVLTKACAAALMRHPQVNAHFAADAVTRFPSADIGIAVATDRGLIVPVIRGADRLRLAEIAAVRADLVARARDAKLQQDDLEGGTFTISNLGMYGIEQFVAVLNPPQVAILAVGAIEEKPVVVDGDFDVKPMMSLTLTCDHRALDGSVAAEFLGAVREHLEEPGLAL